ncbi:MAG: hypothetical protein IMX06_01495 [Kyrpidia tusciae]|nr:DUF294 nucleotidyltransferase-like domain-containing protein [Kyrpidia tusciae]MBE3551523.1 hypothetical protein [Kyrpidia tusciae]
MDRQLFDRIDEAGTPADLRRLHAAAIRTITDPGMLSTFHDRLFCRVVALAEKALERDGWGPAPARYCWLELGSGARREQMISTDQDNALVYDSPEGAEPAVEGYFAEMARRVVGGLDDAGYPLCRGYVMAVNPRWRGTPEQWARRIQGYLDYPDWSNVRLLLIAADQRPACGDAGLGHRVRKGVVSALRDARYALWSAADHAWRVGRAALTALGRLRTGAEERQGMVDIKTGLYVPLVGSVRLWALRAGIEEPGTRERIEVLEKSGLWSAEEARAAAEALRICLALRWKRHRDCLLADRPPDDWVDPGELPRDMVDELFRALSATRALQKRTYQYFQHLYRRG